MGMNPYAGGTLIVGVLAVILSLLVLESFVFIVGLGAVLLGWYALEQIKKDGAKGKILAILGIILGFLSAIFLILQMVVVAEGLNDSNINDAISTCEEASGQCIPESANCGGDELTRLPVPYRCETGMKCCLYN